jgi:hypothetical protein
MDETYVYSTLCILYTSYASATGFESTLEPLRYASFSDNAKKLNVSPHYSSGPGRYFEVWN